MTPGIGGIPGDTFAYLAIGCLGGLGVLVSFVIFTIGLRVLGYDWHRSSVREESPSVIGYTDQLEGLVPSGQVSLENWDGQ